MFGLLLHSQLAHAEIYKWVDEKGTVHFTEDPTTIPEKYREGVKSRATEEDSMTPQEKARAKKLHEEEVRERLEKERKEYDAKEEEKRMKEIERQKAAGKCEIISYSQFEVIWNVRGDPILVMGGSGIGGGVQTDKSTCVNIVIKNNSQEAKIIKDKNIVATTQGGYRVSPKGVFINLPAGQTYRGDICFGAKLTTITQMELEGL